MSDDLYALAVLTALVAACLAIWAVLLAPFVVAFLIWSN